MAKVYSIKLPLEQNMVSDNSYNKNLSELLRQNVKMILLTNPGERIMEPEFGVGFKKFLFEPITPETSSKLESRIYSQFSTYLPSVSINNINIIPLADNNRYNVKIVYSFLPAGIDNEIIEITL
jgi:phage baseplate assembly protein W